MRQDRERWNRRYEKERFSTAPSDLVVRYAGLAPVGRALDIACGNGRNSLHLAELGFAVDAVDISDTILEPLAGAHPRLHPVCADLDTFDIAFGRYSLILNVRFLDRRLFPYIREGLTTGGLLLFESYLEREEPTGESPSCRDYLLRTNELLHAFLGMEIHHYEEKEGDSRKGPYRIASLAAVKVR